jgi:NitT/TauT family transport system substrate-binding protein
MRSKGWAALAVPIAGAAVLGGLAFGPGREERRPEAGRERVRLAYFPNVTHAAAVAGLARGEFQKELGDAVYVDAKVFNAGPEEMEALLAGEVDLGYVGPSPAINTYLRSRGRALRVLAGASSGGAALVARPEAGVRAVRDLDGKRVAAPQLGNTQDLSLRRFLAREGLRPREKGGTVQVIPIKNPDILALFRRGELDAAWVPEPWAARLIHEGGARLVLDERDLWPEGKFTTTVLVGRTDFVEKRPELVSAALRAHLRSVEWVRRRPVEARELVNRELKRLTGKALPAEVLREAWGRVAFTPDPHRPSIEAFARAASAAGYLPEEVDLAGLFFLEPLNALRRTAARE